MYLLPSIVAICLSTMAMASYLQSDSGGWQALPGNYGHGTGYIGSEEGLQDSVGNLHNFDSYGSYQDTGDLPIDFEHGLHDTQHHYVQAVPVSEHIEITKPVPIPVVKNIGVPVVEPIAIPVPHPVAVGVLQPYPVHIPVAQPVPIPIIKTIAVPIEKRVPYPIERVIPVPVERAVPITVEKHIPVPVEKPYPIRVPVYKHVFHRTKSHGHGWSR